MLAEQAHGRATLDDGASAPLGPRVLVVDDVEPARESLVAVLRSRGFDATGEATVSRGLSAVAETPVEVVLSDLRRPAEDCVALIRGLRRCAPQVPIVVLTPAADVVSAVVCFKAGATDCLSKPVDPDTLESALIHALERKAPAERQSSPPVVSPAWRRVLARVDAVARTDSPVLLVGESGSGKDLLAERLHRASARASGPLVRVNCAAIPIATWESQFFGHRRGAFAGASSDHRGCFESAHDGTLWLDEVSAMPMAGQAKLLHALDHGEFERLGESRATRVDVRLVACTNADLERAVRDGFFRTDLFYRLNVVCIPVPPLRDRREDIPRLARHFIAEIAAHLGRPAPELPPELVGRLRAYAWPGNVRELRNVIERALVLDPAHGLDDIALWEPPASDGEPDLGLKTTRERFEREILLEARRRAHGVQKEAARLLGIDPRNLSYFLRKHGLGDGGDALMGGGAADARGAPPAPRTPAPGSTRTPR